MIEVDLWCTRQVKAVETTSFPSTSTRMKLCVDICRCRVKTRRKTTVNRRTKVTGSLCRTVTCQRVKVVTMTTMMER